MQLTTARTGNLDNIKKLYKSAFPNCERKSFNFMLKKRRKGETDMFSIESDSGEFLGLAITFKYKDMVLLDYFAVSAEQRGKGIGSRALKLLKEKYSDKRFFLEIESTAKPHPELEKRKKRRAFYIRNAMIPAGFSAHVFMTDMEILTAGKSLTFEEYRELYYKGLGSHTIGKITLTEGQN